MQLKKKIPAHETCEWCELFRITAWENGSILATRATGFHIRNDDRENFSKLGFTFGAILCKPHDLFEINPLYASESRRI